MKGYEEYQKEKNSPLLKKRLDELEERGLSPTLITKEELKNYYKEMRSPSLDFLRSANNQLRLYIDWLSENNKKNFNNIYKEITLEDLKECVIYVNTRIITREELIRQIAYLPNASDKFFCLALFEGIRGKQYRDLHFIKRKDFDAKNCTVKLHSGEVRKISNELLEYGLEACNAQEYVCYTDDEDIRPYKDGNSGYVFKALCNSKTFDGNEKVEATTLLSKYKYISMRIRSEMQNAEAYLPKALRDSGMINMIQRLYEKDKKRYKENATIKNTILTHKKEIEEAYGTMYSADKFVLRYKEHFKE